MLNIPNLEKLAMYLLSLPADYAHFDMRNFFEVGRDYSEPAIAPLDIANTKIHQCGAVACALGHSIDAGICSAEYNSWDHLCEAEYGISRHDGHGESVEWLWCFGPDWADFDNTPEGAANRILYMIDHGVPDDFDRYGVYFTAIELYCDYHLSYKSKRDADSGQIDIFMDGE